MSKSEREVMFGKTKSGYLWCLHRNRTYKDGEYRTGVNSEDEMKEMCYYEDCDSDAVMDVWDWAKLNQLIQTILKYLKKELNIHSIASFDNLKIIFNIRSN